MTVSLIKCDTRTTILELFTKLTLFQYQALRSSTCHPRQCQRASKSSKARGELYFLTILTVATPEAN